MTKKDVRKHKTVKGGCVQEVDELIEYSYALSAVVERKQVKKDTQERIKVL